MGKRYKGKTCVYCTVPGASETGDHILAREFVPMARRSQIPKVPACGKCNKEKSDLEHYATAALLFGGRHADAADNLQKDGPRRLAKNRRLHRALARGSMRVWVRETSGLVVRALTVPIDGEKIEKLIGLITRGLMWHHWNVVLGPDCFVDVLSLTERGETLFERFKGMRARDRVRDNVGNGALVYEGAQGTDNPQVSIWELSLCGGVTMAGAGGADLTSKFGVITGPQATKSLAVERARRGAFSLPA